TRPSLHSFPTRRSSDLSELVTFKTTGDKKLDQPLTEIGAKGLFTRELEIALQKKKVDCCVHSLKDLPTEMPVGLEIVAELERERSEEHTSELQSRFDLV